ncbi:hypothetical protein [Euzebyella saccharophila]|uniref:hypothetical protein n=1 Tax=Euzebyella saccharophila TaxID=679664 RepID=UPI0017872385|nr:hypothetical protein [Euzebyella saccharophila]
MKALLSFKIYVSTENNSMETPDSKKKYTSIGKTPKASGNTTLAIAFIHEPTE